MKYQCFQRGISPNEFKKMEIRDLIEIFEIHNAVETKQIRQAKIDEALERMRSKW